MLNLSSLCLILGITFTQASVAEPIRLAEDPPANQTMAECAYRDMVESLSVLRADGRVPRADQLRIVEFLARAECIGVRQLNAKENLDTTAVAQTMRDALNRALNYVYRSVDI